MTTAKTTIFIVIIVAAVIGIAAMTALVIWLCKNNNRETYTNLNSISPQKKYQMLEDIYLMVLSHTTVKNEWTAASSEEFFNKNFNSNTNSIISEKILNKFEFIDHKWYGTVLYNSSENSLLFIFRGAVPDDVRMPNMYSLFFKRKSVYRDNVNDWVSKIIKQYDNPTVNSIGYSFGGPRALEIFYIDTANFIPGEVRMYSSTMGARFIKYNLNNIPVKNKPRSWYHVVDRRDILAFVGTPEGSEIKVDIKKVEDPFDTLHYHHARQIYNSIYDSIPKNNRDDSYYKAVNKLEDILAATKMIKR